MIGILKAINLIPVIVMGVEKVFGLDSGPSKLQKALDMIKPFLPGDKQDKEELLDGLILIINGVVKIFNAVGEFTKRDN